MRLLPNPVGKIAKTSFFSIRVSTACSCSFFNFTPRKLSVHTRKMSTTEAAIFVYRNLARAVGIQMRALTDSCHRIKNRPIKSLRHQCAGHQKFNMKPLQSLFSLWLAPPLFADRSFVAYRSSISQQKRDCLQSSSYTPDLGAHITSSCLFCKILNYPGMVEMNFLTSQMKFQISGKICLLKWPGSLY